MLIKRLQVILFAALIVIMAFPNIPATALAPHPQDVTVAYHALTGMVSYMGAPSTASPIREATAADTDSSTEAVARSFLAEYGSGFGITDAPNTLTVLRTTQAENGNNTVRFQQTYQGIPILAGEIIVQMDAGKNVLSAGGEILPNIELDTTPTIDEATAIQSALEKTAKETGAKVEDLQASAPALWIYNPALLTPYKGETVLAWRIEVTPKNNPAPIRQLVLVDAKRGGIPLSFNQIDTAKSRQTYNANGSSLLPGTLVCNESTVNCGGGSGDAYYAHLFAGQTYDFYMTYHNRDSINGAGMTIKSSVNYDDNPYDGFPFDNAFWNGAQMVYGAGFASADDVVAHELTHGVTENESNLFYVWQSGAINESFSDVWGEFMDLTNGTGTDTPATRWQMGEDLPASVGVVRNMSDPTIYGDPDKITSANYYTANGDNGGVHINSGVNNKAAYLMVDGATFNGRTVTGLGITKVAKIYYYAQTNLLTSGSDYSDLYYALQTSCAAQIGIAGITSADCQEVLDAINAVEMNLQPVADYNQDISACDTAGKYPANRFFDNMEAGTGQWVTGVTTGTNRWSFGASAYGPFAHSGQYALFADDDPGAVTDTYVRMTTSVTVPPSGKLLFQHAYALETNYDGGVLEYSTNGGSSWSDAISLIEFNGYDGPVSTGYGNPLGGRQTFTGVSHGYISTRLNLNSLSGQNVMFRWRMGLDSGLSSLGWWLDDVQIYECVRFSDVGTNHWAYSTIEKLAANNITTGCSVGLFCPSTNVTRDQMAVFLLRGEHGSSYIPPAVGTSTGFNDVPVTQWAAAWIKQLAVEGITTGCGNSNFCPGTGVTRDQMAVFLLRAKYGSAYTPPPVGTGTGFSDVPATHWAAVWIKQLAAEGITSGCAPSMFCPGTSVSRDQMSVFLVKTFNLP